MTSAKMREQRRTARLARRRQQYLIIGGALVFLIAAFAFAIWWNNRTVTDTTSGIVTTGTGLQYQDLTVGTGAAAKAGDTVTVNYTGWLADGTKFDSSVDRNQPFDFQLGTGGVILGWDEGVAGMKVGGKRKLIIPPNLGYGAQANGPIPANSTLTFDVELLAIK